MNDYWYVVIFFFQAEDGIRDLVRSRGLGDVYKRQGTDDTGPDDVATATRLLTAYQSAVEAFASAAEVLSLIHIWTLPTSDLV